MGDYKKFVENKKKSGGRSDRKSRRKSDSKSGGRARGRSEGKFRRGSDRSSRKTEMHRVVCDKCGEKCTVPFKPTSSKPVYCSDCFSKSDSESNTSHSSEELSRINKKLDKIMKAFKIK